MLSHTFHTQDLFFLPFSRNISSSIICFSLPRCTIYQLGESLHPHQLIKTTRYRSTALRAWCKLFISMLPAAPCSRGSSFFFLDQTFAGCYFLCRYCHVHTSYLRSLQQPGVLCCPRNRVTQIRYQVIPGGSQWGLTPAASPVGNTKKAVFVPVMMFAIFISEWGVPIYIKE